MIKIAEEKISVQQWFFMLIFANICITPFFAPTIFLKHLQQGALMPVVLAYVVTLSSAYVMFRLCEHFENQNIVEWSTLILGKWIGSLYSVVVILVFYLWGLLMLYSFIDLILYTQLPHASRFLLLLFILFVAFYLLLKGISTFARFSEIFTLILLLALIFINVAQIMNVSINNYLPVRAIFSNMKMLLHEDVIAQLFMFRGVFALYFFYPLLRRSKHLLRMTFFSTTISFGQIFLAVLLPLGIFGDRFASLLTYPFQESIETVSMSLLPIDRVSILTSIVWQLVVIYVMCVAFFSVIRGTRSLFHMNNDRYIIFVLLGITIAITIFPLSRDILLYFITIWSFVGIVFLMVIPLFILLYVKIAGVK